MIRVGVRSTIQGRAQDLGGMQVIGPLHDPKFQFQPDRGGGLADEIADVAAVGPRRASAVDAPCTGFRAAAEASTSGSQRKMRVRWLRLGRGARTSEVR